MKDYAMRLICLSKKSMPMFLVFLFGNLSFLYYSLDCWAGNLTAPIDIPGTNVLPKGKRNVRVKGFALEANDKFGNTGNTQGLGQSLNTTVTWSKLVEGQSTNILKAESKGFILSYLGAAGLEQEQLLEESVGFTTGNINLSVNATIPVLAYGLTDRWTTAIAVPVIKTKVSHDMGFVANENIKKFQAYLNSTGVNGQHTAEDLVYKLADPISYKAETYGYNPAPRYQENTKMGDIKIVNKHLVKKHSRANTLVQWDITTPTGTKTNPNELIDLPSGDGQWDLGVGVVQDYSLNKNSAVVTSFGYTRQFKDTKAMRVPEVIDSALTPDVDTNVEFDLGDIFSSQQALHFKYWSGFETYFAYGLQYKQADQFSGSLYAPERYSWLENNSVQNMQSAQIGIGYSTVERFRAGQFKAPLGATINYTHIISGKNVVKDPLTSFDFYLFF